MTIARSMHSGGISVAAIGKATSDSSQKNKHLEGGRMRWALTQVQDALNRGKDATTIGKAMATAYNADYSAQGKKAGTMRNFLQNLKSYISSSQSAPWDKTGALMAADKWR